MYFLFSLVSKQAFEIASVVALSVVMFKIGSRLKVFLDEFEELKTANNKEA